MCKILRDLCEFPRIGTQIKDSIQRREVALGGLVSFPKLLLLLLLSLLLFSAINCLLLVISGSLFRHSSLSFHGASASDFSSDLKTFPRCEHVFQMLHSLLNMSRFYSVFFQLCSLDFFILIHLLIEFFNWFDKTRQECSAVLYLLQTISPL